MSGDTRIILAIIGVGLGLAGLILQQMSGFRADMAVLRADVAVLRADVAVLRTEVNELRDDLTGLSERVTRIETLLEYALPLPSNPQSEQPPGA